MLSSSLRAGRWPLALTIAALGAIGTACGPAALYSNSPSSSAVATSTARVTSTIGERRSSAPRHTITLAQLQTFGVNSTYELVLRLRPEFLRGSTGGDALGRHNPPIVFIDGSSAGPVSTLLDIPTSSVAEIRYITGTDAVVQHGPTYSGGIIMVRMRR